MFKFYRKHYTYRLYFEYYYELFLFFVTLVQAAFIVYLIYYGLHIKNALDFVGDTIYFFKYTPNGIYRKTEFLVELMNFHLADKYGIVSQYSYGTLSPLWDCYNNIVTFLFTKDQKLHYFDILNKAYIFYTDYLTFVSFKERWHILREDFSGDSNRFYRHQSALIADLYPGLSLWDTLEHDQVVIKNKRYLRQIQATSVTERFFALSTGEAIKDNILANLKLFEIPALSENVKLQEQKLLFRFFAPHFMADMLKKSIPLESFTASDFHINNIHDVIVPELDLTITPENNSPKLIVEYYNYLMSSYNNPTKRSFESIINSDNFDNAQLKLPLVHSLGDDVPHFFNIPAISPYPYFGYDVNIDPTIDAEQLKQTMGTSIIYTTPDIWITKDLAQANIYPTPKSSYVELRKYLANPEAYVSKPYEVNSYTTWTTNPAQIPFFHLSEYLLLFLGTDLLPPALTTDTAYETLRDFIGPLLTTGIIDSRLSIQHHIYVEQKSTNPLVDVGSLKLFERLSGYNDASKTVLSRPSYYTDRYSDAFLRNDAMWYDLASITKSHYKNAKAAQVVYDTYLDKNADSFGKYICDFDIYYVGIISLLLPLLYVFPKLIEHLFIGLRQVLLDYVHTDYGFIPSIIFRGIFPLAELKCNLLFILCLYECWCFLFLPFGSSYSFINFYLN